MRDEQTVSPQGPILSLVRIIVGFLFLAHGVQKILGLLGGRPVPVFSQLGVAGLVELIGGVLVLIGLFTRPAAFFCSGEMAIAYFKQHAPNGFWPIMNRGESAVLYCFVFLYLVFSGGGPWSLDRLLRRHRKS
jgi:putative oxidoreductase